MSITANVNKFFQMLMDEGFVTSHNQDDLIALWKKAHMGRPCPAIVVKDGPRQGQSCGRPCMKSEETCMCHLPKDKMDAIRQKTKEKRDAAKSDSDSEVEVKEKSKMSKEEWNQYFNGHWNFGGARQDKHLAMTSSCLATTPHTTQIYWITHI
jgi:RNA recognition motif-containing protein